MTFNILSHLQRDVPLASKTTLELGGQADYFVEVRDLETLKEALWWAKNEGHQVRVLSGGSNVIIPDEGVRGLVIAPLIRRFDIDNAQDSVRIIVGAGEHWDDVVKKVVDLDLSGIECLSGIPGWAGATPIQNVGAYGQEISDVLLSVHGIDLMTFNKVEFLAKECEFAYRTSRFKKSPNDFLITHIEIELKKGDPQSIRSQELKKLIGQATDVSTIRHAVIALRKTKSMVLDENDINRRSAGSFFTNPIVDQKIAQQVIEVALKNSFVRSPDEVPQYPASDGQVKLAAAWLIEKSGFQKGIREGAFGLSTKHTLAIVHHGGGTTYELLAFAERIRQVVKDTFGVVLEREPVILS